MAEREGRGRDRGVDEGNMCQGWISCRVRIVSGILQGERDIIHRANPIVSQKR
jgi:hypothetical protein